MQLLNSKNYESVSVIIRDYDEPLVLSSDKGLRLMDYLTGDVQTKHVKLTDIDGNEFVILITDIKSVMPNTTRPNIKDYI